jgi:hypothetical protein
MTQTRYFQITYRLKNDRYIFVQPDTHMSHADAWYYACLHSGLGLLYGHDYDQQNHEVLRSHAQTGGLIDVIWEELPS